MHFDVTIPNIYTHTYMHTYHIGLYNTAYLHIGINNEGDIIFDYLNYCNMKTVVTLLLR